MTARRGSAAGRNRIPDPESRVTGDGPGRLDGVRGNPLPEASRVSDRAVVGN